MDSVQLRRLLEQLQRQEINVDSALQQLKDLPYQELGYAKLDHHRAMRNGFPEVIYCPGKTEAQIITIFNRLADRHQNVLATRAQPSVYHAIKQDMPEVQYNDIAGTISLYRDKTNFGKGKILVVSAGTADLSVAEEAVVTARMMGNKVESLYDVGVAGIHRLFSNLGIIQQARVLIVVAGMEGALASVVGGMVDKPVIAVPTSVGYGANFGGLSALLTMLTSCASGITVVNIDNGFGAGYSASLINRL